jgi:hypothetical protein
VQYRNVNDSNWTDAGNAANAPFQITGLTNGQRYEVRLSANNGIGDSEFGISGFGSPGAELQIVSAQDGYSDQDGYWTPLTYVSQLVDAGVQISNVLVDGESSFTNDFASKFGSFTYGDSSVGIPDGIVMSAANVKYFQRSDTSADRDGINYSSSNIVYGENATALNDLLWASENWIPNNMSSGGGEFSPVCTGQNIEFQDPSRCAFNSTFIDFDVVPTQDFLKFEYAIAGTEVGEEAYAFPDGFALYVGGHNQVDNCALIPSGTIENATLGQRYLSVGNLRLAGLSRAVDNESPLHAADISQVLSCVVDISEYRNSQQNVHVTMGIANANDDLISPAVFLKANSIRFDAVAISTGAIPAATVNASYQGYEFTSTGGTAPYTYSVDADSALPSGLALASDGTLSGTPTSIGTSTFTIQVSDSNGNTSSQNFSMVVNPAPIVYDEGRINLDADLISGQSVSLENTLGNAITGFDPSANLRLSISISSGQLAMIEADDCGSISMSTGMLDAEGNIDKEMSIEGTQAALNCYLKYFSVTSDAHTK